MSAYGLPLSQVTHALRYTCRPPSFKRHSKDKEINRDSPQSDLATAEQMGKVKNFLRRYPDEDLRELLGIIEGNQHYVWRRSVKRGNSG